MKKNILNERSYYKPFEFPEAYKFYEMSEKMHWMVEEIPMHQDVIDWNTKLTPEERNHLTQIFRFFTQSDCDIAGAYANKYLPIFKKPEIRMMLLSFAARECFDDQTELLTSTGWKLFKDVNIETDLIAEYDLYTKEINFAQTLDYIKKEYKGKLHHYKNKRTDICVTPKHRLITINPHSKKYSLNESEKGKWGKNFLYPVNGKNNNDAELTVLEKLLIAIQADGSIRNKCESYQIDNSRKNDFGIIFNLKKERKIIRLKEFLDELKIDYNPIITDNGFTKFNFTLEGLVDLKTFNSLKEFGFLNLNIGTKKANQIIEELILWDGSCSGSLLYYYNTNEIAIDKIQAIAILSDYGCSKSINRNSGNLQVYKNKHVSDTKTCYVLTFVKESTRCYPHRKEIDYDGFVYCVTMPKGTVITRRNNNVSIQGNCVHIKAYSHLIDTLGMPDSTYKQFHEYTAMREKHEYFEEFLNRKEDSVNNLAKDIAMFSAFTEGMQLFSSFIMLLNFTRFNKMNGMGQLISWSIRDESLHCEGLTWLFRELIKENRDVWTDQLKSSIYTNASKMVELEDKFIDLSYEGYESESLNKEDLKTYIRYITDRRLIGLSLKGIFKVKKNPLPWVEEVLNAPEHSNFFETKATAYSKSSMSGNWNEVWK